MNIKNFMIYSAAACAMFLFAGCGNEPVFTEMSTNRLKIVIKGTLESENPVSDTFDFTPGDPAASFADDSVDDEEVTEQDSIDNDFMPTTFMFDIAEIKLNGKAIGNYRQVFSIPLDDNEPFFDGTGITLKNDDPGNGSYSSVQLYIRKMIFDSANIYSFEGSTWSTTPELAEVIFHEDKVYGFNFNNLQVNSYWDSLRDNASSVNRIYPLEIPIIGGMNYDRDNDQTVLEIRLVIKNFIKMYEYDYYDDGIFKVCHFYGLSDWLRDVRADEHDMGRNIHAVARAYVPGKTGTINMTGTAAGDNYVMAVPSNVISRYRISKSGSAIRDDVAYCDLPVPPTYSGAHIESVLDYYCNYEAYKIEWNSAVDHINTDAASASITSLEFYVNAWENYEGELENFIIPPYITKASGGSFTFQNVAPGDYYLYYFNAAPSYGNLFDDTAGAWTQLNGGLVYPVTVP